MNLRSLVQATPLPRAPRPIVSLGAGGIVRDAHLPAYRLAGFSVASIFDLVPEKARALAQAHGIPRVCPTLADAIGSAPSGAVFDLAVPAPAIIDTLRALPRGAHVLIQKPLGENLAGARAIVALCAERALTAAVNFQLRYAPAILAARQLLDQGAIGELHDMEVRVTAFTPWKLWTFLEHAPRVEILYHSIHYVDLIRSFFGEPHSVQAKTTRHPATPDLAATRTHLLLDYGDLRRAGIATNHGHDYGRTHQESYVKWEGTRGAIKAGLGVLLNYPTGEPDTLEFFSRDASAPPRWISAPVEGAWFPHAFIGPMADLMRFANGEIARLPTGVADAFNTMAVVEAAYQSSAAGGVRPEFHP